jgi:hypothetical protein
LAASFWFKDQVVVVFFDLCFLSDEVLEFVQDFLPELLRPGLLDAVNCLTASILSGLSTPINSAVLLRFSINIPADFLASASLGLFCVFSGICSLTDSHAGSIIIAALKDHVRSRRTLPGVHRAHSAAIRLFRRDQRLVELLLLGPHSAQVIKYL